MTDEANGPGEQTGRATLPAAPPATLRHSPLAAWQHAHGAQMVGFGGWEMPLQYADGTVAEHMACRTDVAVFDVSHLGTVRLAGPEARPALQRALTNDLAKIRPGKAQYTHLLDEDGSVLDDLIVWWTGEDSFDVMPNASNTSRVLAAIGGTDVTAQRAVLAVQGPRSRALMETVLPEITTVGHFGVGDLTWRGVPVVVAGTGYTGEEGLECAVPAAEAVALWEAVVAAGAAPAGLGARDTLRLEAGLPLHGHELGPGITPLEAGLGWVVAWDKPGGFRGRDALVAQRARGTDRVLRGLIGPGRQPLRAGYRFSLDGVDLGELTSGNFSPVLGCGIGMAFVAAGTLDGDVVDVEARGRRLACQVVHLPFVKKPG